MRIATNVSALNAWRNLTFTNNSLSKTLEKLSSGYRINRAADDAAGLAISEKMRGQINGLNMAVKNAQDGISLIQTAEGALNEAHAILQRMRELAVQSASDTNTATDRAEIQKEIDQLAEELTRIGNTTEFNTKTLLDGSLQDVRFHIGANEGQNIALSIGDMRADALGVAGAEAATFESEATIAPGTDNSGTAVNFADGAYRVVAISDYTGKGLVDANVQNGVAADVTHVMVDADGEAVGTSVGGTQFYAYGAVSGDPGSESTRATVTFLATPVDVVIEGNDATATIGITDHKLDAGTYTIVSVANHAVYAGAGYFVGLADANGDIVALGANGGSAASAPDSVTDWVDVNDTTVALLSHSANDDFVVGSEIEVTGAGINVSEQASADAAITIINNALETVSAERSKLGALQNRLDHTINNLSVAAENLSAAESRIRDVDMALEMANFTRNQILVQAGTAMLAQANAAPQSVLQLLG